MSVRDELAAGIARLQLDLTDTQLEQLAGYLNLLIKWNKTFNLTAVREPDKMVSYHLLDSLSLVEHLAGCQRLLDVGSGGGMPGIPAAIARPDLQVVLLDTNSKKTSFLKQVVIELGLPNVEVITARVEEYQPEAPFQRITSRAFAELCDFVSWTRHLLASDGEYLAMKGVYPHDEIARLPSDAHVVDVTPLRVPGLDAERHLVRIKLQ